MTESKIKKVFIFGAGGHTKQVIDIFKMNKINIGGIFDDNKKKGEIYYYKYEILDSISNAKKYFNKNDILFCGIGDNNIRKKISIDFSEFTFTNCISPLSNISITAIIGTGNYIGHFVNIGPDTKCGSHNIINDGTLVMHDVIIGDFNHLATGSRYNGNIKIGICNLFGSNCVINPKININNDNIIGSGSVIINDIDTNCTIVGNPGRIIKK